MATVLSLPSLPLAPPSLSTLPPSARFPTSRRADFSFRHSIWSSIASDRTSFRCNAVDSASSSSSSSAAGVGAERNVGLETHPRSSGEEQGACTTSSGCGSDGIAEDGALRGRREVLGGATLGAAVLLGFFGADGEAVARDRRSRKEIAAEDYVTSGTGLKYFDVQEGKGTVAEKGETVMVHFDCVYRNITAVSSRESKILAGNRTIAEPYELTVGAEPGRERKRDFVENANGLFSAQAAPKPPPALYAITEGMRVGGKRTVIVPPELGYGQRGLNEIPPGATFDLNIELLEVKKPQNENGSK